MSHPGNSLRTEGAVALAAQGATTQNSSPSACSGTWLVFALGATDYAVQVGSVRSILGLPPITRVPQLPPSVRGVINLRGQVIPVVDLRIRFGLEAVDHGQRTCIIVLQAAGSEFGVVVDRVIEVARIEAGSIEQPPRFGADIDTEYLLGVAKHGERVRLLLDMDRAVSSDHVVSGQALAALSSSAEPAA